MTSVSELIDDGLRAFLEAHDHLVLERMRRYELLLSCKWSPEEALIAAQIGYEPGSLWSGSYVSADSMQGWINHHYRQTKAETVGLDFDEFVTIWRQLGKMSYRLTEGDNRLRELYARRVIGYYMHARRYGLCDEESRTVIFFYPNWKLGTYIQLRRRLHKPIAQKLMSRASSRSGYFRANDVWKALRRGATLEQVTEAIWHGALKPLASPKRSIL